MAGVCRSVTSHLDTVEHGDTWGRVKAQFGTDCQDPDKYKVPVLRHTSSEDFTQDRPLQGTMEPFNANSGLPSAFAGDNAALQSGRLWRPWTGKENKTAAHMAQSFHGDLSLAKHPKTLQVVHPVKLFWPKSRCFDYLYQDAEMLLRNYPVQATICLYEDSSSDEDSDVEEEDMEKELN